MEPIRFVMRQEYVTVTCNRCGVTGKAEPNPYCSTENMGVCSVAVKPWQRCGGTLVAQKPGIPAARVKRAPIEATPEEGRELEEGLEQLGRDIGKDQ